MRQFGVMYLTRFVNIEPPFLTRWWSRWVTRRWWRSETKLRRTTKKEILISSRKITDQNEWPILLKFVSEKSSLFYGSLFHFENILRNKPSLNIIINKGTGISRPQRKCMLPSRWYRRGCIIQFHKQFKAFKFHEKTRSCRVVVFILDSSSLTL